MRCGRNSTSKEESSINVLSIKCYINSNKLVNFSHFSPQGLEEDKVTCFNLTFKTYVFKLTYMLFMLFKLVWLSMALQWLDGFSELVME